MKRDKILRRFLAVSLAGAMTVTTPALGMVAFAAEIDGVADTVDGQSAGTDVGGTSYESDAEGNTGNVIGSSEASGDNITGEENLAFVEEVKNDPSTVIVTQTEDTSEGKTNTVVSEDRQSATVGEGEAAVTETLDYITDKTTATVTDVTYIVETDEKGDALRDEEGRLQFISGTTESGETVEKIEVTENTAISEETVEVVKNADGSVHELDAEDTTVTGHFDTAYDGYESEAAARDGIAEKLGDLTPYEKDIVPPSVGPSGEADGEAEENNENITGEKKTVYIFDGKEYDTEAEAEAAKEAAVEAELAKITVNRFVEDKDGQGDKYVIGADGQYLAVDTLTEYRVTDKDGRVVYVSKETYDQISALIDGRDSSYKKETVYTIKDADGNDQTISSELVKDGKVTLTEHQEEKNDLIHATVDGEDKQIYGDELTKIQDAIEKGDFTEDKGSYIVVLDGKTYVIGTSGDDASGISKTQTGTDVTYSGSVTYTTTTTSSESIKIKCEWDEYYLISASGNRPDNKKYTVTVYDWRGNTVRVYEDVPQSCVSKGPGPKKLVNTTYDKVSSSSTKNTVTLEDGEAYEEKDDGSIVIKNSDGSEKVTIKAGKDGNTEISINDKKLNYTSTPVYEYDVKTINETTKEAEYYVGDIKVDPDSIQTKTTYRIMNGDTLIAEVDEVAKKNIENRNYTIVKDMYVVTGDNDSRIYFSASDWGRITGKRVTIDETLTYYYVAEEKYSDTTGSLTISSGEGEEAVEKTYDLTVSFWENDHIRMKDGNAVSMEAVTEGENAGRIKVTVQFRYDADAVDTDSTVVKYGTYVQYLSPSDFGPGRKATLRIKYVPTIDEDAQIKFSATIKETTETEEVVTVRTAESVSITGNKNIIVGESLALDAIVKYSDGSTDSKVTWSVANEGIDQKKQKAEISPDGVLTALAEGKVIVKAKAGDETAEVRIEIKKADDKNSIVFKYYEQSNVNDPIAPVNGVKFTIDLIDESGNAITGERRDALLNGKVRAGERFTFGKEVTVEDLDFAKLDINGFAYAKDAYFYWDGDLKGRKTTVTAFKNYGAFTDSVKDNKKTNDSNTGTHNYIEFKSPNGSDEYADTDYYWYQENGTLHIVYFEVKKDAPKTIYKISDENYQIKSDNDTVEVNDIVEWANGGYTYYAGKDTSLLSKQYMDTTYGNDYVSFDGWYTDDGSRIGDSFFEKSLTSDVTLYAKWKALETEIRTEITTVSEVTLENTVDLFQSVAQKVTYRFVNGTTEYDFYKDAELPDTVTALLTVTSKEIAEDETPAGYTLEKTSVDAYSDKASGYIADSEKWQNRIKTGTWTFEGWSDADDNNVITGTWKYTPLAYYFVNVTEAFDDRSTTKYAPEYFKNKKSYSYFILEGGITDKGVTAVQGSDYKYNNKWKTVETGKNGVTSDTLSEYYSSPDQESITWALTEGTQHNKVEAYDPADYDIEWYRVSDVDGVYHVNGRLIEKQAVKYYITSNYNPEGYTKGEYESYASKVAPGAGITVADSFEGITETGEGRNDGSWEFSGWKVKKTSADGEGNVTEAYAAPEAGDLVMDADGQEFYGEWKFKANVYVYFTTVDKNGDPIALNAEQKNLLGAGDVSLVSNSDSKANEGRFWYTVGSLQADKINVSAKTVAGDKNLKTEFYDWEAAGNYGKYNHSHLDDILNKNDSGSYDSFRDTLTKTGPGSNTADTVLSLIDWDDLGLKTQSGATGFPCSKTTTYHLDGTLVIDTHKITYVWEGLPEDVSGIYMNVSNTVTDPETGGSVTKTEKVQIVLDGEDANLTPPVDVNAYIKGQTYTIDTATYPTLYSYDSFGNETASYTFKGWTDADEKGTVADNDIIIKGTWEKNTFTPGQHAVSYQTNGLPVGEKLYTYDPEKNEYVEISSSNGNTGIIGLPSGGTYTENQTYTIDSDKPGTVVYAFDDYGNIKADYQLSGWSDKVEKKEDGTWVLGGPVSGSKSMGTASVEYYGVWAETSYNIEKYKVDYRFESGTAGRELPQTIIDETPEDSAEYVNNQPVNDLRGGFPAGTTRTIPGVGTWTFNGWTREISQAVQPQSAEVYAASEADASDEAPVNKPAGLVIDGSDISFVGVWTFTARSGGGGGGGGGSTPRPIPVTPPTDIPEEEVPLAPGPDIPEGPAPGETADIPEGDIPLADIPEGNVPLADIPDEEIPLADAPSDVAKTGDDMTSAAGAAGVAGLGMLAAARTLFRRRKEDK